ncbi:hypothetical protein [Streptomyces sp. NPDC058718]|uniref:hypothetical protein n=1 Tax=Streptomyces sp. NPDC058718 TaxID=3346610 RepID=UPI0036853FF1
MSVRLGGRPALHPAEPVWRSVAPETDLTLVRLTGPSAPGGASPPPMLGRLDADPARIVPVTATGFPALAGLADADRVAVRDSYQVTAEVATHSYVKTGRLELRGHARSDAAGARWRGLSGGAVFAEDTLIGVVVSAAARTGRLGQVLGLLRRMHAAHPDHRVPALAALAEALSRRGEHAKAVASLDEAFTCFASRQGGADEQKALAALVTAGTAVDPARSRRQVVRLLADRQRTPALLPAVLLADPELAPLTIDLLGGSPAPDGAPGDTSQSRAGYNLADFRDMWSSRRSSPSSRSRPVSCSTRDSR